MVTFGCTEATTPAGPCFHVHSINASVGPSPDEATTATWRYQRNQQYSITAVTTSSGSVAERYAYTVYGQPTILDGSGSVLSSSAINNRYTYTGREWDQTLGLYHFRARWMSGLAGRFMGRDPIGYAGSEWGLYELFDSVVFGQVDPTGLGGRGTGGSPAALCCNGKWFDPKQACCDGEMVITKRSCADCCNEANQNHKNIDFDGDGKPDGHGISGVGFIACCDKQWCSCSIMGNRPSLFPIKSVNGMEIIRSCVWEHETEHINDSDLQPCLCGRPAEEGRGRKDLQNYNECQSYRVQRNCLNRKQRMCGGDPQCLEDIRIELVRVEGHILNFCSSWFW
jgi:RHS repeat-associated protein